MVGSGIRSPASADSGLPQRQLRPRDWFHLLGNLIYLWSSSGAGGSDRIATFILLYLACGLGECVAGRALRALPGEVRPPDSPAPRQPSREFWDSSWSAVLCPVRVGHLTMPGPGAACAGDHASPAWVAIGAWLGLQSIYAVRRQRDPAADGVCVPVGAPWPGWPWRWRSGCRSGRATSMSGSAGSGPGGAVLCRPGDLACHLRDYPRSRGLAGGGRLTDSSTRPEGPGLLSRVFLLWLERRRGGREAAREMRRHFPTARRKPIVLYRPGPLPRTNRDLGWASHTSRISPASIRPQRTPKALDRAALIEARGGHLDRALLLYRKLATGTRDPEGQAAGREAVAVERIMTNRRRSCLRPPGGPVCRPGLSDSFRSQSHLSTAHASQPSWITTQSRRCSPACPRRGRR